MAIVPIKTRVFNCCLT